MNKFLYCLICSGIAMLARSQQNSGHGICGNVQKSDIENACDSIDFVEDTFPCFDQNDKKIAEYDLCMNSSHCCWRNDANPRCFKKPEKCYVDLRIEKCFTVEHAASSIKGIYTGYSINGTYCLVPHIVLLSEEYRKELGYIPGAGFPIHSTCRNTWQVEVHKLSEEKCKVLVHNTSDKVARTTPVVLHGTLRYGRVCVYEYNQHQIVFEYREGKTEKCACLVEAWLQSITEDLPVSNDVKNYVKDREGSSTCTQVLGMITRSSWMHRISLTNKEEVDAILNALTNLTEEEKWETLSLFDARVFLNSTKKVAQYSFHEGMGEDSAQELITKTASVMSNLIGSLEMESEPKSVTLAESRSSISFVTSDVTTRSLEEEEKSAIKHDLFETVDYLSQTVASRLQPPQNATEVKLRAVEKNVDLSLVVTSHDRARSLAEKSNFSVSAKSGPQKVSVLNIPESSHKNESSNDLVALISVFYEYPVSQRDPHNRRSNYLSVNVRKFVDGKAVEVSVPVNFTLKRFSLLQNLYDYKPTCSFLISNSSEERERWDDFGCFATNYDTYTTCVCNHTTNFAVLMKVTGSQLSGAHSQALKIIALVLGAISIACLVVTLLVFINYRQTLLKDRMLIHFHLVIALLLGYTSLLASTLFASDTVKFPSIQCLIFAICTHLFFLAVFFWSLVEGVYLFYKIVLVFSHKWAECVPYYSPIIGWACPFVIVGVSFLVSRISYVTDRDSDQDTYANPATCFLTYKNGMIWAYAGPVVFVIVFNIIVLMKVTYVIFKSSYTSSRFASASKSVRISESLKRSSRGALILMPILGIPTIVSLLYNLYNEDATGTRGNVSTVVGTMGAYLQDILCGVQGILIFLFYCVYNADVRNAYSLATMRRKSVGALDINRPRKRSRIPLLFGREDAGPTESNNSPNQIKKSSSISYGTARRKTEVARNESFLGTVYGRSNTIGKRQEASTVL